MAGRLSNSRINELKHHVLDRIKALFKAAEASSADPKTADSKIANRQVHLARTLSMKFKVPIPRVLKRRFCKHCYHYLVPGRNCRVRLTKHKVVYYCLDCKKFARFPYLREIKEKRRLIKG